MSLGKGISPPSSGCMRGCSPAAMVNAASNGHLEVVKYVHTEIKQPATSAAITAAAENGHLLVVNYLHENRTEACGANAILRATRKRHTAVVKYLLKHDECRAAYKPKNATMLADGVVSTRKKIWRFIFGLVV